MTRKPFSARSGVKLGDIKGAQVLSDLAAALTPAHRNPVHATTAAAKAPRRERTVSMSIEEELLRCEREPQPKGSKVQPARSKKMKNPKKAKFTQTKVKISREDRIRIYGLDEVVAPAPPPTPNHDWGKKAFDKIAKLRPALRNFPADHRAPLEAGAQIASVVARRIATCISDFERIIDPDSDGFIGYDFGTSSTKAVVRWPYRAGSPALAIPVPEGWCSGGQPHIWPSIVFFDPARERFSLLPGRGRVRMEGFKAALVDGSLHRMIPGTSVTLMEATVAFLALHLAYVLGAVAEMPDGRVSLVNVAIPVAALDRNGGSRAQQAFDHAVRSARSLLCRAGMLTLNAVKEAIVNPQDAPLEYDLHPELSGVMAGYCRGPRHHVGSHMIIDCGSATLDMATFRLEDSDWPLQIYAASVELLGSDASEVYRRAGAGTKDCAGAARYQDHQICARSIAANRSGFTHTDAGKFGYQVILAGGGIDKPWIAQMLEKWQSSFHRPFMRPILDSSLRCEPGFAPERLVLADGLARDPIDLKKVNPPSEAGTEHVLRPNQHDWTAN